MNAPPQDPQDNTHRDVTRLAVYFGEPDADQVSLEKEVEDWRVMTVHHGLGMQCYALLERNLGKAGKRVENRKLMPHGTRIVEIWTLDSEGERVWPLFRGELMGGTVRFASGEEVETAFVIVPHAWFGNQCKGQQVFDPVNEDLEIVHLDLEFNPLVDGRIIPNCARHTNDETGVEYDVWIDVESARTTEAKDLARVDGVVRWTLDKAIESLQGYLNPDETYLKNFKVREASGDPRDPQFDESPELEDLVLPRGQYLSGYLDTMLPAYGHQWAIDFNANGQSDQIEPKIWIMRRGGGDKKRITYQKIGDNLDTTKTNALSVEISTDVSQLANVVEAQGSLQEREVTIELERGWSADLDITSLGQIEKRTTSLEYDNVWRKFVGNEAGDYIGTRPEITEALDLSTVFEEGYVSKRRPIEDCLTYRAGREEDAVRIPPILEYSVDDGETWTRYDDHDWRPLTHELGVYLTDPQADGLIKILHDAGEDAKLRITGTIRGDKRINHEVDRTDESPTSIENRLFLDVSNRFHDRGRAITGPHASLLSGVCDERDDQDELEEFVEKVADSVKAAVVGATLPLHGLELDYLVGDVVDEIPGRNLVLNRLASDSEKRGVQVVGITWNVASQQTMLVVQPWDSYVAAPAAGNSA